MFNHHLNWFAEKGADLENIQLKFLPNQLPSLYTKIALKEGQPVMIFGKQLIVSLLDMAQELPAVAHLLKL
jgi:hypothetical protein